jgi:hypothetical protein
MPSVVALAAILVMALASASPVNGAQRANGTTSQAATPATSVAVGAMSPNVDRTSSARRVLSNRKRGLAYKGLAKRETGRCAGAFQVRLTNGDVLCTTGPDSAPPGVDVTKPRSTRSLRAELSATSTTPSGDTANDGVQCIGDGKSGPRVQTVYAVASDRADRYSAIAPLIRQYAAHANTAMLASAAKTGAVRHIRFVTSKNCSLNVARISLSPSGDDGFGTTINELQAQGFDRDDRKYMVWADSVDGGICGIGTSWPDDSPGPGNASDRYGGYSRIDTGCWGLGSENSTSVELHELMHNLGAVQANAPNATQRGHCTDEYDVMCYVDASGVKMEYLCPRDQSTLLDCGNNDYFHTSPAKNSYLASHWNTANSIYLSDVGSEPPPSGATRKLVDDKDPGFRRFRQGWRSQTAGYGGRSFWTKVQRSRVRRYATWTATLDTPGRYSVWAKVPWKNATTRSARYKINSADGLKSRSVNQARTRGRWVKLGTHRFGSTARVKLSDRTQEPSGSRRVVFDVVRFVPASVSSAAKRVTVDPKFVEEPAPRKASAKPKPEASIEPNDAPGTHPTSPSTPESTRRPTSSPPPPNTEPAEAPTTAPIPPPEADAEPTPAPPQEPEPTPAPTQEAPKQEPEPPTKALPEPTPVANRPPVADAGGPYKVDEGDSITLDGRGSADADGKIVAYDWSRKKRLDDATKKRPTFSAIDDGKLEVALVVTDDIGASDTASATVKVRNVDPSIAELGPFEITVGAELVLDAIVIRDPGKRDTHEVHVDWGDGSASLAAVDVDSGTASARHAYVQAGEFQVDVSVRDDDGGSGSTKAKVTVSGVAAEESIQGT